MRALVQALLCGAFAVSAIRAEAVAVVPACAPKTAITPDEVGSPIVVDLYLKGICANWWCPVPDQPGHMRRMWLCGTGSAAWEATKAAIDKIRNAPDKRASAQAEVVAAFKQFEPVVGTQTYCDEDQLRYDSCVSFYKSSRAPYPTGFTDAQIADPGHCGVPPVCKLTGAGPVWRTPTSATSTGTMYKVVNGVRQAIPGQVAPKGALCNWTVNPIKYTPYPGGPIAYYYPLDGGPTDVVTLCQQVSQ
jgi:hypothetical protein